MLMVDTKDEGVLVKNDVEDDIDDEHFDCGRDDYDENVDWGGSMPSRGEVGSFRSVFFCCYYFKQSFLSFSLSLFVIFTQ